MTAEQANEIMPWWQEQSFTGKELFKLEENGTLLLKGTALITERVVAAISVENCDAVLKNLQEKFDQVESRMRDAEVEWLAASDKQKMAEKVSELKAYINTVEAVGDLEKYAQLINDWEKAIKSVIEENTNTKKKLTEMAESIADSADWKETTQAFKDIADQWKKSGFIDKGRNDALWNRIEAARKKFHDRKRDHHEDEEKDLLVTLDLKMELAEKAEALAQSEEWKNTSEAYNKLLEEWKTIGRTLPKKNEELWQRIINAKNTFFERKRVYFNQLQQEQEANYLVKLALTEKAESLKDSTDWSSTAQIMVALMDEWKKSGRAPQDRSDEIWKRFSDASECFFEARRKHNEEMRGVMENNYTEKAALLQRAEELKNSSRWGDTTVEMNRLFEEWKKIGKVAKEHGDGLWEAFIAARKHFFARKDADRDQKKQHFESQKVQRAEQDAADTAARAAREIAQRKARIQQAHDTVAKATAEIKEEEEKLADFKNGLENITPGKKAEELRSHLIVLIADTEVHIKKLHNQLAKANEELKQTEEREKASESLAEPEVS